MRLSDEDSESLGYAKNLLENPTLAARITDLIGRPIEAGIKMLPQGWSDMVNKSTMISLEKALDVALLTLHDRPRTEAWEKLHKLAVTATGAGGGAFGLAALPFELPVSTTIMLRSIADIARSEGERLHVIEAKLACLEVFALGGRSASDDASYFFIRGLFAKTVSQAAKYIAEKGLATKGAPALVKFITQIATRFGASVSQKVAAQAVPGIGAVGGAIINLLFIDHFQSMARGHFIVRRLERNYSPELVRKEYETL
jgi:hypothetical protein